MVAISACIISYNEENKIEACLQSLQEVADEIIVVDSLSQDATLEIAKKYTDKIYSQAFLGYGAQKNFAVSKASHPWILALDCDERLSPRLKQSILEIKEEIDLHDAYCMARRTYYVYRWLNHCWYPDKKVRLYNKLKAQWSAANVHESIEVDGNKLKMLDGDIYHYSFDSISDHIATLDKFSEIGAADIIRRGKKVNLSSPLTHGLWTFFKLYVLQRGFLDGFAGFVASALSLVHVFVKYSKVICYYKMNKIKQS